MRVDEIREALDSTRNMVDICLLVLDEKPELIYTALEELLFKMQGIVEEHCCLS